MAEYACISVDQEQFSCPICLNLLKDPVTVPCGHSFCMLCINSFWDKDVKKGIYNCPQCRMSFEPRPVLHRNNMLADVVEKLKKTELLQPSPAHSDSTEVACDFCTETKQRAVRSCLMCLASFCETHLKPHYEVPGLKKHKLIKASTHLQEKICSRHDKIIDIYCRTDQSCICYLCTMDEHKRHDTVAAVAERTKRQHELKEVQKRCQQKLQEKQKIVEEVKQAVDTLKRSAQAAVEDSERIFTEIICSIKQKQSEAVELIRDQEKAELSRAQVILDQLEQEIAYLKKNDNDLEKLLHTEDHVHFLQSFMSLSDSAGPVSSTIINIYQHPSFDGVRKPLSDLKEKIEEFSSVEFKRIVPHVAEGQIILPSEPVTRSDFLKYFTLLTLDPNTVYQRLVLSEKDRVVAFICKDQLYPAHPDRFDCWSQVMCKEMVCKRSYWEVEFSKGAGVSVSVSYKRICRKGQGNECGFGRNKHSWSLYCSSTISYCHNNIKTEISETPCSKIGVYVDHSAGTLSFYSVSDTVTLLHKVQTTFSFPLFVGFGVFVGTVRLCDAK